MPTIRRPAVAGQFYPADPQHLKDEITGLLAATPPNPTMPKAIIAPHAGYIYSGAIAASAYKPLQSAHPGIERVVLLGPAHRVAFRGLALSSAEAWQTPLGSVALDHRADEQLLALPQVMQMDEAHRQEHSLEVQLPFLQQLLRSVSLLPLVVGEADTDQVAEVLEHVWGEDETLIVVSSDLSHFHDYNHARILDADASRSIETLQPERLGSEQACGHNPIRGLLAVAARHGLQAETLDLRNSGDTAGSRDRVVGYGAYVFH